MRATPRTVSGEGQEVLQRHRKDSLEQVFRLYYALESEKCSAKHKTIIYGALAYLVSPIDIIPDLTPLLGYTDDMGLIATALVAVAVCIDDVVKTKAKEKVDELLTRAIDKLLPETAKESDQK